MDTDLKLKLINNKITDQKLKNYLLKNKDIILRQFKLILSNPYIDIKDPNIYLKPFDEIDLILNNQDEIKSYQTKLSINFGNMKIIEKGQLVKTYIESDAGVYMREEKKIDINICLNLGSKNFTAYTMDLTKNYIDINADYRS